MLEDSMTKKATPGEAQLSPAPLTKATFAGEIWQAGFAEIPGKTIKACPALYRRWKFYHEDVPLVVMAVVDEYSRNTICDTAPYIDVENLGSLFDSAVIKWGQPSVIRMDGRIAHLCREIDIPSLDFRLADPTAALRDSLSPLAELNNVLDIVIRTLPKELKKYAKEPTFTFLHLGHLVDYIAYSYSATPQSGLRTGSRKRGMCPLEVFQQSPKHALGCPLPFESTAPCESLAL
jgi:hypothetical protein